MKYESERTNECFLIGGPNHGETIKTYGETKTFIQIQRTPELTLSAYNPKYDVQFIITDTYQFLGKSRETGLFCYEYLKRGATKDEIEQDRKAQTLENIKQLRGILYREYSLEMFRDFHPVISPNDKIRSEMRNFSTFKALEIEKALNNLEADINEAP